MHELTCMRKVHDQHSVHSISLATKAPLPHQLQHNIYQPRLHNKFPLHLLIEYSMNPSPTHLAPVVLSGLDGNSPIPSTHQNANMASMPIIVPAATKHTHTVVFLHGRGDVAEKFVASLEYSKNSQDQTLQQIFPSFRWVFPKASVSASFSFGGNKISQWFDIWNVRDFSEREEVQILGLKESIAILRKVLDIEAGILGGHWDKIILAGISQGAATATHALLNLKLPVAADDGTKLPGGLAAFLGFSCRMPFPGRALKETRAVLGLENAPEDDEAIRKTPVLLEHCVNDPLVLVENGRVLRDTLRGFGAQVHWREYPDGGHWFHSPAGMDDVAEYLTHVLGLSPPLAAGVAVNGTEMDLS